MDIDKQNTCDHINPDCAGFISRARHPAVLYGMLVFLIYTGIGHAEDMSVNEILAQGCTVTPTNFSLNTFWNNKMKVIPSFCDFPSITKSDVNGLRKPRAFINGSAKVPHDRWAAGILNGDGETGDDLGIAPNTDIEFGEYCSDATPLTSLAQNGDVVFSLRDWAEPCAFLNPGLKTIPIVGFDNEHRFIGDARYPDRILITHGANYGQGIDYYTTGSRRISFAIPEFAGIVVALNTALIASGFPPLTMANVKDVLDASSDEVYLEVDNYWNIYKEYQVDALLQNPENKYFGQLVDLANAIDLVANTTNESPRLTLSNNVTNSHGGDALVGDFQLLADGENFVWGIPQEVTAGSYTLSTSGPPGYASSAWLCDGGFQLDENTISLQLNQNAKCTITLKDIAPEVTIVKSVTNENGGTAVAGDFILHLSGGDYDDSLKRTSGDLITVDANTRYTLYEEKLEGYSRLKTACIDDDTGANPGHPFRLSSGQSVTCTINNIDRPEECFFYIIGTVNGKLSVSCL